MFALPSGRIPLDAVAIGHDPPTGPASDVLRRDQFVSKAHRVHCTHGAPVVSSAGPLNTEYLDAVDATGVIIAGAGRENREAVEHSDIVMFLEYTAERAREYLDHTTAYSRRHGRPAVHGREAQMGGPGMIAVSTLGDLASLEEIRLRERAALGTSTLPADYLLLRALEEQPVMLRVQPGEDVLTPGVANLVQRHAIEGLVFSDPRDVLRFQEGWCSLAASLSQGGTVMPEPSVLLQGDAETLLAFFGNEQHFKDGNPCDGYIVDGTLSRSMAEQIRNARIRRIADAHDKPLSPPKHGIRLGIVNLQGAAKMEREMLDRLIARMSVELRIQGIETVMVHTRQEMEHLTGLVLPGGWHGPQLGYYNAPELAILDGVRAGIQHRMALFLSCAGAIVARNEAKEATGCSSRSPASIGDYGVRNNVLNGRFPIQFRQGHNGGTTWDTTETVCIGAPTFSEIGDQWQPVARTDRHQTVAVERTVPEVPAIIASSIHSSRMYLRWLEAIVLSRSHQFSKTLQD